MNPRPTIPQPGAQPGCHQVKIGSSMLVAESCQELGARPSPAEELALFSSSLLLGALLLLILLAWVGPDQEAR